MTACHWRASEARINDLKNSMWIHEEVPTMAVSETLTLWQMEGFPNVFICIPLPPFSSFLLDAVTAVSALQSTTEDRELGYVEKLLSETEGEGEMPGNVTLPGSGDPSAMGSTCSGGSSSSVDPSLRLPCPLQGWDSSWDAQPLHSSHKDG